jgi:hypothetical protein
MKIDDVLVVARADAARLSRFMARREGFLGALDWSLLSEDHARQSAMLDDLLEGELADSAIYLDWLEQRVAEDNVSLPGVLRFAPHPRPWHAEWITLAS